MLVGRRGRRKPARAGRVRGPVPAIPPRAERRYQPCTGWIPLPAGVRPTGLVQFSTRQRARGRRPCTRRRHPRTQEHERGRRDMRSGGVVMYSIAAKTPKNSKGGCRCPCSYGEDDERHAPRQQRVARGRAATERNHRPIRMRPLREELALVGEIGGEETRRANTLAISLGSMLKGPIPTQSRPPPRGLTDERARAGSSMNMMPKSSAIGSG